MPSSIAIAPPKAAECSQRERSSVGIAGWTCWLSAATKDGLARLRSLFEPCLLPSPPSGNSGIALVGYDTAAPRIRIVSNGETLDFRGLLAAPEYKDFKRTESADCQTYASEILGGGPLIEVREGAVAVLQPAYWPLVAQLAFVMLLLHERRIVNLHAAVSAFGEHSLVLLGPSGAGKSTLSWALHQQGAEIYGDEWTFITLPEFHQYPWQRNICLRPGGMELLEDQPRDATWYEAKPNDPKCAVAMPKPTRPCPRDNASLIFMDGFAAKPTLTPMPGGEATRRLLQGMGYGDPSIAARLDVAADLVNHYPCWRLAVGPPDETAALLAQYAREAKK